MGGFLSKLTAKCQYVNDRISQHRSKQSHLKNEGIKGEIEDESTGVLTTNITDLTEDCLVKIFECLDIQNLLHVAIANRWLRPAAAKAYKNRFGGQTIHLNHCGSCNALQTCYTNAIIYIYGLKTCLLYLRCFGSSIKSLQIDYNHSWKSRQDEHVHRYINTYCAYTLIEIEFLRILKMTNIRFLRPFVNVRCVSFVQCDLSKGLRQFVKWFPNSKHLKLNETHWTRDGSNQAHFRHLERLCISGFGYDPKQFMERNAANILRANRQLQGLEMYSDSMVPINTLLDLIKHHSFITKLHVKFRLCTVSAIDPLESKRIANEHPSLVDLDLRSCTFTAAIASTLIDQLKSLKSFDFHIKDGWDLVQFESNLDQDEWMLTKRFDWAPGYVRLNRKNL